MEIPKVDLQSENVTEDTLEQLKKLIPTAFREGKINFDALKAVLGEVVEPSREFYNFTWAGKSEAFRTLQRPSTATLKPVREESVDFDTTENIFIEGDNLEVLKLLQKTYHDKIKMIYIDPPYNKDKDFVYPDRWSEGIKSYKEYCNFINEGGNITTTENEATSATGRKHSRWLTMMYPRLFLARSLLKDDGIIFISIDDDEVKNLRMICDEIFGEENYLGQITWKARVKPINIGDPKYKPQKEVEYVLVYQKQDGTGYFRPLYTGSVRSYPYLLDGRKYRLATILKSNRGANHRDTMTFALEANRYEPPEGQRWQAGYDEIHRLWDQGYIEFSDENVPFRRYFEDEEGAEHDPFYCYMDKEWSSTSEAGKHILNKLLGPNHGFDTVKPTQLITTLLMAATDKNSIVLDFFAGSGTTAHSTMKLNSQDGGNRKFILVQLPEGIDKESPMYQEGYTTIAEITKMRIRRAGAEIAERNPNVDIGFKTFVLDESNFKQWNKDIPNSEALKQSFIDFENNVIEGSDKADMLYELLLKKGYSFNASIEKTTVQDNEIFIVDGGMYVCMDEKISKETIDAIIETRPVHFIVLDKAFEGNDELKTNTFQTFKTLYQDRENPFETV